MPTFTGKNQDLKDRTRKFAVRIIELVTALPKSPVATVLGNQLLRSGTSVGAHYYEGSRGRSASEYISKLEVALQELEETKYWMLLLVESKTMATPLLASLQAEASELSAILFTCVKKAKEKSGSMSKRQS